MNLDRSRILLSKLHIKDRDKNISVPFKFNPNQVKAFNVIKHHYAQYGSIRVIILKARRVGMCLHPSTRILTAELKWIPIEQMEPGAEIIGADDQSLKGRGR